MNSGDKAKARAENLLSLVSSHTSCPPGEARAALGRGLSALASCSLDAPAGCGETIEMGNDAERIGVTALIDLLVAELDRKASDQIGEIYRHPMFRQCEKTISEITYLLDRSGSAEIWLMNTSGRWNLESITGQNPKQPWETSHLNREVGSEFYQPGGNPFNLLVVLDEIGADPSGIGVMGRLTHTGAANFMVVLAGAPPGLVDLETWRDLDKRPNISRVMAGPQHAPYRSLRESADSRYLALAMPSFRGRHLFRADQGNEGKVRFEERIEEPGQLLWLNAAVAVAANICAAHNQFGWAAQIVGPNAGGRVVDLPMFQFDTKAHKNGRGADLMCPVETVIRDDKEQALSECGFLPLVWWKDCDWAAFLSSNSIQKPPVNPASQRDTRRAWLAAQIGNLLVVGQFAKALKAMCRLYIGRNLPAVEIAARLQEWIGAYVISSSELAVPGLVSEETRASRPLAAALVKVQEDVLPGRYLLNIHIQLHQPIEQIDVAFHLEDRIAVSAP